MAARTVNVTLSDGGRVAGTVVGTDPRSDLALVKIDGGPYSPLPLGSLDRVEIGQWIRQTPFGQLTPELLEWIRNDDEAFVQDFSTFILSKQPAEAAV